MHSKTKTKPITYQSDYSANLKQCIVKPKTEPIIYQLDYSVNLKP